MCGIVGKIQFSGTGVEAGELVLMRDCLIHRGPDDAGIYISPNRRLGLGHRRLSIIDLTSAGHQPLSYKDRYWIVYNGELYNFPSLKTQLKREGYSFKSQTDTEVIVAMYDRYGPECLKYLRGMFAFAIYDEQKNILFCARDRVGQKPFKYFYDGKTFLFASELKAILTQPEYKREPDYEALHHYLTYQYVPAPRTGFRGIRKLPAGHYLTVDIGAKKIAIHRWWQLSFAHKEEMPEREWQKKIVGKLDEATKLQMVSDVPLGAFLSGGIDSSAVVALMSRHAPGRVKTFSIGFPEAAYSELTYARRVADHFKTDHVEFVVKPDAVDILPALVASFEEPYADSSAIPTYYLSKLAREQVTVALNGDGGDENFAGYPRYNFHKLALALFRLHLSAIPFSFTIASTLFRYLPNTFTMRAARFFESLPDAALRRYVTYLCYFTNAMKKELYQPEWLRRFGSNNSYDLLFEIGRKGGGSLFDQALYADSAMYLPDDLLVKVDIASMMVSLEARSPFLDHEVMELAARIPGNLKLAGFRHNKYILKQALKDILPASIISRPKMGFVAPIERWFRGDMHSYLRSVLLGRQTRITQEMFRPKAVRSLLQQHTTTKTNVSPPLFALLTLELWLRHYF